MKSIPTKDALELWAIEQFKQAWLAFAFSQVIPAGGTTMPRRHHAACFADVVAKFMAEYEADTVTAVFTVMQTVLGNSSQLGAKLLKDKWLTEAEASATADALLASLLERATKK